MSGQTPMRTQCTRDRIGRSALFLIQIPIDENRLDFTVVSRPSVKKKNNIGSTK